MMFFKVSSATSKTTAAKTVPAAMEPAERDWTTQTGFGGFETFGRSGLDIGGLHRDQQWVGAWGGRC
ncbi:hypothetical protein Acid7E03_24900 [Acidisoma sp. 7E03]